jgi:hypothetical protein
MLINKEKDLVFELSHHKSPEKFPTERDLLRLTSGLPSIEIKDKLTQQKASSSVVPKSKSSPSFVQPPSFDSNCADSPVPDDTSDSSIQSATMEDVWTLPSSKDSQHAISSKPTHKAELTTDDTSKSNDPIEQPRSALKTSKYQSAPHNEIPSNDQPISFSTMGAGVPINTSDEFVYADLVLPAPSEDEHPTDACLRKFHQTLEVIRQFDQSFRLLSLWDNCSIYTVATQHKPRTFTSSQEWIDVPNVRTLMTPRGTDEKGQKRRASKQYGTILFHSKVDSEFLVNTISPILDKMEVQLSIKSLQHLRCNIDFAIIGVSTSADIGGVTETVKEVFEREIREGVNSKGPISKIDEVPPFVIVKRQLRLLSMKKFSDLNLTNLELYDRTLRQAFHLQTSASHKSTWEVLIYAVEQSKLLQKLLGVNAHFVALPKGNEGEATRIVFHRKVEAHMAYQA